MDWLRNWRGEAGARRRVDEALWRREGVCVSRRALAEERRLREM
ncbi:MAG: hypothetical protein RML56_13555 [Burkholderiales bacterium]|nr:hypothetical protein [Burkholderiales bacterium]